MYHILFFAISTPLRNGTLLMSDVFFAYRLLTMGDIAHYTVLTARSLAILRLAFYLTTEQGTIS